ncbi:hypothetical protein P3T76_012354 [Phytophthora citrophthora]|uniref:Uncharacterized protein n=1 Tax=Phytophthora citrophthora TaxID=4793 RepID=A0AAD9LDE5_9STRA|nr:hypothetical protein P3T76_012354 [Phytophthora citrophthora]
MRSKSITSMRKESNESIEIDTPSPLHPRRQQLSETQDKEEGYDKRLELPSQDDHGSEEGEEGEEEDSDFLTELRLGERFLNVMALMARLSTQSLGNIPVPTSAGGQTNTERSLLPTRTSRRGAISSYEISSPPPPSRPQLSIQSPPKSPIHEVRKVAKRLPRSLQGPLTFDICMLLPTPLDERQSPLKSPIRRKRLRKRVRRRTLRRRAKRTWLASHASWPAHASADYIADHTLQDVAAINAARLVERLGERKVNGQTIPRVLSMPLPPLQRNHKQFTAEIPVEEGLEFIANTCEDDEIEEEGQASEYSEETAQDEIESEDDDESNETPSLENNSAEIESVSPQEDHESTIGKNEAPAKKRPLYHRPAWISPELHVWLVKSGLFATKPRRELQSTSLLD